MSLHYFVKYYACSVERMPFDGPAGVLMETSSSDAGTEAEGGQDEQQNHQLSNSAAAIFFVNVRQPLTRRGRLCSHMNL